MSTRSFIRRASPHLLAAATIALVLVTLGGCANRRDRDINVGAEDLYEEAREHLRNGNLAGAEISYRNLLIRFPVGDLPIIRQAQLDLIYVYYRTRQPERALDGAETFIRENPDAPEVAYCLYMMGLIYFDKQPNALERLFKVDVTERPPDESMLAFTAFRDLIRDYPNSRWADDARQRMIFLRNRLAIYENHVARYYLDRGAPVAALNRGKFAIENYPGAPQLEETLQLLIEAYTALGMDELARDTERVLQENFGNLPPGFASDGP